MPSYKFTYFDVRGRGELCRYLFHAAGRDFEDYKVNGEEWPTVKQSTPFGQLPFLEVDGQKIAESGAIARFLAREFDLAGKNSWEQGLCDQYMELVEDMFKEVVKMFMEKDEEKKKELKKDLSDNVYPKFLGFVEKAYESNGGEYLVGKSLTVADLCVFNAFDTPLLSVPTLMDSFPKLKAARAKIEAIPKVAEYLKTRKHSDI